MGRQRRQDAVQQGLQLLSADGALLSTVPLPGRFHGMAADGDGLLLVGSTGEEAEGANLYRVTPQGTIVDAFAAPLAEGERGFDEGVARGIGTSNEGLGWQQTATYLYPRFYGVDVTYRFSHWL